MKAKIICFSSNLDYYIFLLLYTYNIYSTVFAPSYQLRFGIEIEVTLLIQLKTFNILMM